MKTGLFNSKTSNTKDSIIYTLTFVENSSWTVPKNVTSVEVFAVGGGGGGGIGVTNFQGGGNGGNGGQVLTSTVTVTPGETISIVIGAGGGSGGSGAQTRFGIYVIALQGNGGRSDLIANSVNSYQSRGGTGSKYANSVENGEDGRVCPFDATGKKYGAGGSGAYNSINSNINRGGETGGGDPGETNDFASKPDGRDGTFYGAGGGGGLSDTSSGGKGFQGILKIRFKS